MSKLLLRAKGLRKSYTMGKTQLKVLDGASVTVDAGEFLVITGASGSGKSTLLHLLGALDIPDAGNVEFNGVNVFTRGATHRDRYRNLDVGFVFQFYHLLPELTVLENTIMPRMVMHSAMSWLSHRGTVRKEAETMLDRMGLSQRAKHRPSELSGGERQRVAIARALINNPSLLLADEPTGNLDERIGDEILELLAEFNQRGQSIIMVTHDERVASRAHRRLHLTGGTTRDAIRTNQPSSPTVKALR